MEWIWRARSIFLSHSGFIFPLADRHYVYFPGFWSFLINSTAHSCFLLLKNVPKVSSWYVNQRPITASSWRSHRPICCRLCLSTFPLVTLSGWMRKRRLRGLRRHLRAPKIYHLRRERQEQQGHVYVSLFSSYTSVFMSRLLNGWSHCVITGQRGHTHTHARTRKHTQLNGMRPCDWSNL